MYVKTTSGSVDTYPYSIGQLRRDNPTTSFPKQIPTEMLESYDVYPVAYSDPPSYDERTQQIAEEDNPSLVDGVWTVGFATTNKTTEQIAAYDNDRAVASRATRNSKLAETDFYALSDMTMSDDMTSFRQSLRDLPSHSNWPNLEDADWPTKP